MDLICEVCKKPFKEWRKDRTPRFCSRECRIKSKDKIIKCPQCGVEFRVSLGKDRKFCSSKCSNSYYQQPDPDKRENIKCKNCGVEFEDYKYRKTVFCSHQCKSEYGARQPKPNARRPENFVTKKCVICEKEFTVHKSQDSGKRNASYCSVVCALKSKISAPELKCKKILEDLGIEAHHQYEIKNKFIVDFRIDNIILQVDGEYWHGHSRFEPLSDRQVSQKKKDAAQDKYLAACGYKVIRIWESEVNKDNIIALLYSK